MRCRCDSVRGGAWLLSGRKASAGDVLTAAGAGCLSEPPPRSASCGFSNLSQLVGRGPRRGAGAAVATRAEQIVQVIGKLKDTALYVGRSGYDVLNVASEEYNFGVNVQWLQKGIDAGDLSCSRRRSPPEPSQ